MILKEALFIGSVLSNLFFPQIPVEKPLYEDEYITYEYQITNVDGEEINGVCLTDDFGIYLEDFPVELEEGDIVKGIFDAEDEEEMIAIEIEKSGEVLFQMEDGSFSKDGE